MSGTKVVSNVFYFFLLLSFATGFAIICFTDLRQAPKGKILQFHRRAYPHKWQLRTGLLLLLLISTILAFVAVFKQNHQLNMVVAILIVIIFIIELSFGIKVLTYRNEQKVVVEAHYDGNTMLQQYSVKQDITKIFDFVQVTYSCCGITDYRDWAATTWAAVVQKANAVPTSCCKMPAPGCGDDLDIKDPFENIYVQGCTQLLYFSKTSDFIHGGVGLAVLFLHWSAVVTCLILACAVTVASGLSPVDALKGEEPAQKTEEPARNKSPRKHAGKSPKKQAKAGDGSGKHSGDVLDYEEENRAPKGARGMLIDKSELENNRVPPESEISEAGGETN